MINPVQAVWSGLPRDYTAPHVEQQVGKTIVCGGEVQWHTNKVSEPPGGGPGGSLRGESRGEGREVGGIRHGRRHPGGRADDRPFRIS